MLASTEVLRPRTALRGEAEVETNIIFVLGLKDKIVASPGLGVKRLVSILPDGRG